MKTVKLGLIFVLGLFLSTVVQASGVTLCLQKNCQSMTNYKTEEIIAQLNEMFSGDQREILFCAADEQTNRCLNKPISFLGYSNLMQVDFQILFARLNHVKKNANSLEMSLDYQIKANQYYPRCIASDSFLTLSTSWNGGLRLLSPLFDCRITELGMTQLFFQFDVDYVNLDTGYFGGFYRVFSRGDVLSPENKGYALFRLTNSRHIEQERLLPQNVPGISNVNRRTLSQTSKGDTIFGWTSDEWAEKWNKFKETALKIIYLEPLDD